MLDIFVAYMVGCTCGGVGMMLLIPIDPHRNAPGWVVVSWLFLLPLVGVIRCIATVSNALKRGW